jgi:hypothetical protein
MRSLLAFVLITIGTVGASLGVARTDPGVEGWISTFQVDLTLTLPSLFLLAAGIAVKRAVSREARKEMLAHGGSLNDLQAASRAAADGIRELDACASSLDLAALHARVDALLTGAVSDFTENRQALIDAYGIAAYARVMSAFAPGERYLNRAWSASTDGYPQETVDCVRRAVGALAEAQALMAELEGTGGEA